ncbi:MAG TPA: hypothetical protein VMO26_15350 [Vicinamibacterales bacterium]|nr:hypothetical protein [Vicinamibacterales bacterium]
MHWPTPDPDRLNRWLTLLAHLGVLAGLLLLIIELGQNRQMTRAQTRNELAMGVINLMTVAAGDSQLAGIIRRADAGEELTADEYQQYRRYTIAIYRYYENAFYQYRQGLYDKPEFDAQQEAWKSYAARSEASVAVWCEVRTYFSPDFAAAMDQILTTYQC